MDLKYIVVMVVGFAIAMFGMKKQKAGASWGQALAIVGALIAIVGAIMNLTGFIGGSSKGMAREKRYMFLQAKFLGDAVKKACNPAKVCVICDPNLFVDAYGDKLDKEVQSDYLDGIRAALKGSEIIPIYPEFKRPKPKNAGPDAAMMVMPYTMLSGGDYKKMCEKIKKAKPDAVINIYQFPMDSKLPASLGLLKGYKVGFLNTSSNDELTYAFADGGKQCAEVVAVVMTKVDAVYDETIPAADQKAFDRRFVLALPGDYEKMIKVASGSAGK